MDLNLIGHKVLITGASQGIGRAVAKQLAAEGCDLCLVARSEADLATLQREIGDAHNVAVDCLPTDLSVSANQQAVADRWPDVDILVNNAGAIPGGRIDEVDEATWRAAWDLKVFGYINMTRHYYALMKARGKGVILNIIGAGGERPAANYIAGATANAGLMAFTRALGGDSASDGIRVVGLNPGPVATDRLVRLMRTLAEEKFGDAERWEEIVTPLPFGRAATSEEIANMTAFLVSELSAYTSGTIVTIDGGHSNRGSLM